MATPGASGTYDAVVVGSGPNGLSAAVRLAQAGCSVLVLEANQSIGGGARSAELTLPGFAHDLCSAVYPLAAGSPYFTRLSLEKFGLHWVHPEVPLAHPLENAPAVAIHRSVAQTAGQLEIDQATCESLISPLVRNWENLVEEFLQPILHWPKHPLQLAGFGWNAMQPASRLARRRFRGHAARAVFAGLAAHSFLPLDQSPSAAFALVLWAAGHAVGWPIAKGGSQRVADALALLLRSLGGEIQTGCEVRSLDQLPKSRATLLDVSPRQFLRLAGNKLTPRYQKRLERFRYGPGIFKVDYALSEPIPWAAPACRVAGTIHVGGKLEEIERAEDEVAKGKLPERPFVLLAQPTLFDNTRCPANRQIAWAYCHVPAGSTVDMTGPIERQIERFAPGFQDCILARHTSNCAQVELKNANLVNGAIDGGLNCWRQLLARPVLSGSPYRTPIPGVYLCSASTPPGGGVHGMCGFHAAELSIRDWFS